LYFKIIFQIYVWLENDNYTILFTWIQHFVPVLTIQTYMTVI